MAIEVIFYFFVLKIDEKNNNILLRQRKPNEQVTVDFGQIINTKPMLELTRVLYWIAGRDS